MSLFKLDNWPPKWIFMGTPDFAVPVLRALHERVCPPALVVTRADRPRGRGRGAPVPPAVKNFALSAGMPVSQPESVREPAFISAVAGLAPDLVVVAAYGKILPGALLDIPASGCINVHASLLPCYRGAAPVNRAVMNGEVNTGVTVQKMAPALDSGDVILQMKTEIGSGEGADDLYSRLGALGAEAAVAAVLGARKGMEASPQDGMGVATWAPPLKKEDGLLDWTRAAVELHNRVRGLRPWPGAYSYMEGRRIRVLRARPAPGADVSPGRVVGVGPDSIAVSTGDGALELLELQAEGGRSMSAVEFARGVRNLAGKVFSANGTGGPR